MDKEQKRLITNQRALLEAMPEMVLLIDVKGFVESMNQAALEFFGDLRHTIEKTSEDEIVVNRLIGAVANFVKNKSAISEFMMFNGFNLQYFVAPFTGYKGEILYWLIVKDITEQKRHKEELKRHQNNIDSVLDHKISQLKESTAFRKTLSKDLKNIKSHLHDYALHNHMVGASEAIQEVQDMVLRVASVDATVLITGESGTGKELAADMIHTMSNRKDNPFLKINCSTINETLLESELFGHERGAFTDAHAHKKGKFEVVDGGTIFLDEIGDISPRMQAALLRVLQNGEIIRVGSNTPIKVDVRVIAATNNDLAAAVKKETFRLDLYYRLNIINVAIPPLRARKEDIFDLANHFIKKYSKAFEKDISTISEEAMNRLLDHDWPGNIRELENIIQRSVLMTKSNSITEDDVSIDYLFAQEDQLCSVSTVVQKFNGTPLRGIVSEIEKEVILQKLGKNKGDVAKTANALNIGKTVLYDKLKKYDISAKSLRN
ncbi:MAG TPA: sigma 54-interacting transcriptional regulator [Desulfopila sp.]|nr:sigma 54-interacting transcriptional regulator [Desulfopila sp.]